ARTHAGWRERLTTIERKCNFLGTARDGVRVCEATLQHEGQKTHVWDALVSQNDRTIALFHCTQMILW
ncbi:MAG: PaaI family thioesterase, partial [Burkholderiales bacterium]